MFLHVIDVKYLRDYALELSFSDGRKGVVDLSDELNGAVFQPLREQLFFAQVILDSELHTVVGPTESISRRSISTIWRLRMTLPCAKNLRRGDIWKSSRQRDRVN